MARIDYGIDAPPVVRKMFVRGAVLIVLAAIIHISNGPAGLPITGIFGSIGITFLIVGAIMVWSSRVGKLRMRDRVLDAIPWRGDEKVLDIGCGRGLMLIGAAKRLKTGKVIGVDIWQSEDLSGNSPDAALTNAKAEGLADRIKIDHADARKLPQPDRSIDTVVSSLMLHNVQSREERIQVLAEMVRVLKPGGHLAILDVLHTADYAKELERLGLEDIKLSGLSLHWCLPTRYLTGRKPSSSVSIGA